MVAEQIIASKQLNRGISGVSNYQPMEMKLGERVISLEELQMHATQDDCWVAIDGKVYDFTGFLEDHPAGK